MGIHIHYNHYKLTITITHLAFISFHSFSFCSGFASQDFATNLSNVDFFVEQNIGNACGTIGILHACGNLPKDALVEGKWLHKYFAGSNADDSTQTQTQSNAQRLESDPEIQKVHTAACSSEANSTERGDLDQIVNTHFVAFVRGKDDQVYEMDGRKEGPVCHGPIGGPIGGTGRSFGEVACGAVKGFMLRDPDEIKFTILAICKS